MKIEYIIVKEKSEFCNDKSSFLSLLKTNGNLKIKKTVITLDDHKVNYALSAESSKNGGDTVFHLTLNSDQEHVVSELDSLNVISRALRKTIGESGYNFYINTVWDETSNYYSEKSYPLINNVENLMRKLIFLFMLKTIGKDWINIAIPKEVRSALQKNAKRDEKTDLLRDALYHANFDDLAPLIFKPYSTYKNESEIFQKLEKVKKIEELEEIIELKPKSNWERYFSEIKNFETLKKNWEKLYEYRNMIAHNRLINETDAAQIKKLTDETIEIIERALDEVENVEISEDEKRELFEFTDDALNRYKETIAIVNQIINSNKTTDYKELTREVNENLKMKLPNSVYDQIRAMEIAIKLNNINKKL